VAKCAGTSWTSWTAFLDSYCCRINIFDLPYFLRTSLCSSAAPFIMEGSISRQQGSHNGSQHGIDSLGRDSTRMVPSPSIFDGQRDLEHSTRKKRKDRRAALERQRYWRWVKSHTGNSCPLIILARNVEKERQRARDKWRRLV
jgi:hypothetical protein